MVENSCVQIESSIRQDVLESLKLHESILTKFGAIKFENGIVYKGEWLSLQRSGFGIQTFPCGSRYGIFPIINQNYF